MRHRQQNDVFKSEFKIANCPHRKISVGQVRNYDCCKRYRFTKLPRSKRSFGVCRTIGSVNNRLKLLRASKMTSFWLRLLFKLVIFASITNSPRTLQSISRLPGKQITFVALCTRSYKVPNSIQGISSSPKSPLYKTSLFLSSIGKERVKMSYEATDIIPKLFWYCRTVT